MKTLLVVDDSSTMRRIIAMNIDRSKLEVETIHFAEHGQAALELLATTDVDLILTDINMPVMGGIELIRSLREQNGPNSRKPIVVLSTESSDELVQTAISLGADGYLLKPFTPDSLDETLSPLMVHA